MADDKLIHTIVSEMMPGSPMLPEYRDQTNRFGREIMQLAWDHAYGDLWTRPNIDRRLRSIITVSMMIGSGDLEELKIHIPAAVRNGVSLEEIEEIIFHATGYVGFPTAANARGAAIASLREAGMIA